MPQRLAQVAAEAPPEGFYAAFAAVAFAALVLVARGWVLLARARAVAHTPTSRIRSAAQGYVELQGRAALLPGPEIVSPLTGVRCCWWQYRVEERDTALHSGRRSSGWRTMESAVSDALFRLDDGTGGCVIDPIGAKVTPSLSRHWYGGTRRPQRVPERSRWLVLGLHRYRYTERLIRIGDPLYAIGWFRTQGSEHEFSQDEALRELLGEWKRDSRALLRRFDRNGDGEIDLQEWEDVRAAAKRQVQDAQIARASEPDVHVLSRPRDRRPFLLSARSPAQMVRRARIGAAACFALALVLGGILAAALQSRGLCTPPAVPHPFTGEREARSRPAAPAVRDCS